jgi:hypothetical protein
VATNIASVNTAATNIAAIIDAPNQATAAANSATAAAASAAAGMYSAVQDKSANYTVVAGDAGDLIRVTTTSGAVTITLPTISTVGDGFKVAIVKWTSDGNAVSVVRSSTNTINGATSYNLGNQYSSATFVADLETGQWFAVASGLGVSNVAVDAFSGNNSTTAFTLSGDPGSENNTQVYVSGVYQEKDTYSVSGTTLTFSTAPPTGTSNIEVVWTAPLAIGTPSDGTVTTAKIASSVTLTTPTIDTITSAASTALTLKSAGTTAVTIDTSQNTTFAGIQKSSLTSGNFALADQATTGTLFQQIQNSGVTLKIGTENSSGGGIFTGSGSFDAVIGTSSNRNISFATFGTTRMTLDNSGNLLVGKTVTTFTTDGVWLQPAGTAWLSRTSDISLVLNRNGTDGQTAQFYKAGTQVGSISVTGSATAFNTSSDYRLKNTIAPMTGALAKVALLKPCTYKWNLDGSDGQGFIAHELDEVVSGCVTGAKDAVDADGNPVYQGIDTSFLVATLTAAIQELKAMVDSIQSEFDAYKATHP